ncbi:hypothetical protein DNU06_12355 [Putridiphycobacter roseus]|uniref:Secretion system C-terminal sorting domain-containing protein n=1 Tax=Putridiphycobacter roseus TaxID=2219161 RepID=A0A2W1MZF3_9FLAO|nr:T9SS type A sorting domain-containing protein [Putridiphycobacter roseus]PZE16640.1 hypothetical protein DNU06_12355 [Putridiphycobacter roseus]
MKPSKNKIAIILKSLKNIFNTFLFIAVFGSVNFTHAQTEDIVSFEQSGNSINNDVLDFKIIGDKILTLLKDGYNKKLLKITDLNTKQTTDLLHLESNAFNVTLSDSGVFYLTHEQSNSSLRRYRIHNVDFNGNIFKSNGFYYNLTADPLAIFETEFYKGEFFIFLRDVGESKVWKSHGENLIIPPFFETENLLGHFILSNKMVFVTQDTNTHNLISTDGITISNYHAYPQTEEIINYRYYGSYGQYAYYNIITTNDSVIYRTDMTSMGSSLFLSGFAPKSMAFKNNQFLFTEGVSFNSFGSFNIDDVLLYKGSLNNPGLISGHELTYASNTKASYNENTGNINDTYFYVNSIERGLEIAHINAYDSIELVADLVPGKGSPIPVNINGYSNNYGGVNNYFMHANKLYAVLTNRGDDYFYLYEIDGKNLKSLFKIEHPEGNMVFYVDDNYIYWYVKNKDSLILKRRSFSDLDAPQPAFDSSTNEEWFRQLNLFFRKDPKDVGYKDIYPKKIRMDKAQNVFVEFYINPYGSASDYSVSPSNSTVINKLKNVHVFAKYDKNGTLQWMNQVGGDWHFSMLPHEFELDAAGNLIIVGGFFQNGVFDDLTVINDRAVDFVCKLNGATGKVMWEKNLFEDYYTDNVSFEGIAIDESDNIYIPLFYRQFQAETVDGHKVTSIKSIESALMKLDAEGNVLWLKNTPTPWLDYHGYSRVFNYNASNKTIVTVQNQMYYNTWMSCAYKGQNAFVQTFDLDGNLMDTLQIGGNDMTSLTEATFTEDGNFFGMGYYRNHLGFGPFEAVSSPSGSCYTIEGFKFKYDKQFNKMESASTTVDNEVFYPIDLRKTKDNIYVLGTDKDYMLQLLKFTTSGDYVGVKYLNQWADLSEFQFDNSFDINDEYIVLLGQNFKKDTSLSVRPLVNFTKSACLLKIKNEGWINEGNRFEPINLEIPAAFTDFVIYPNPFNEVIHLTFDQQEIGYNHFVIHELSGKFIHEGDLNKFQYQSIDLSYLISGVYVLTFTGPDKSMTYKIVKL